MISPGEIMKLLAYLLGKYLIGKFLISSFNQSNQTSSTTIWPNFYWKGKYLNLLKCLKSIWKHQLQSLSLEVWIIKCKKWLKHWKFIKLVICQLWSSGGKKIKNSFANNWDNGYKWKILIRFTKKSGKQ